MFSGAIKIRTIIIDPITISTIKFSAIIISISKIKIVAITMGAMKISAAIMNSVIKTNAAMIIDYHDERRIKIELNHWV